MFKKEIISIKKETLALIDWANVYGWHKSLGWEVDLAKLFYFLDKYKKIIDKRLYYGVEIGQSQSENFKIVVENLGFSFISKEVKWTPVSLEKSYFKKIVQDLFDVLDDVKNTNSEFSNKLYSLTKKLDDLQKQASTDKDFITISNGKEVKEIYDLIEELDSDLKKLNINIDKLQENLKIPVMRRKCDFDVEITRDALNLSNNFKTLLLWSGDGDYAALVEDLLVKGKKVIVVFAPGHKGKEYDKINEKIKSHEISGSLFLCSVDRLANFLKK
jgi:uncharacterized LabA/DUF88 family protein